jgi:ubiquinone/menaquinone biosynthesis C-methylase UbiE
MILSALRRTACTIAIAAAMLPLGASLGGSVRAETPSAATPRTAMPPHQHHHEPAAVHHSFEEVTHWTKVFDDPSRGEWQKPAEVIKALQLAPGMRVVDLGAGTGYFSRYLSAAVGDKGAVFSVDTEPNLVVHLRERAEQEHTANVVPVLASFDNPRIPAGVANVVLIVDTFHHIDDRTSYFRHLQHALAPHGRVAIVDFKKEKLPVGPPVEHKIARGEVIDEMKRAGYELAGEPSFLPYQYFLIFGIQ